MSLTGTQILSLTDDTLFSDRLASRGTNILSLGYEYAFSDGASSAAEPTIESPSPAPGDLAADRTSAKRIPIQVVLSNTGNRRFVLWLKFKNDDRGHVVYDSVVGFVPPFNDAASAYIGGIFTIMQVGGWQDDPQWLCVNGNGNTTFMPVRPGASGSSNPPHS